jgi:chemotaxis signal transduction protein
MSCAVRHRFSQSFAVQFTMSGGMKETGRDETKATDSTRAARTDGGAPRRLFVMRTGARLFAVYADEVEATCENLRPTPLPFAPAPVRGVVSRRGRILTLIDPLPLLPPAAMSNEADAAAAAPSTQAPPSHATQAPPSHAAQADEAPLFVVALKGDEQLALSVESIEREIELYDTEADAATNSSGGSPLLPLLLRRTIQHDAHAVSLLDPAHLFDAAMRGVERRRRRT